MRIPATYALTFLLSLLALTTSLHAIGAQPANRIPRIGVLAERPPPDPMLAEFVDGLRDLGYVEGRNVVIERRYGTGAVDKYPDLIAEMIRLGVDVIVVGGAVAARSAKSASATVPIVFTSVGDPVAAGLVASLSRPNGNATGVSNIVAELSAKQLELLKLASPGMSRVVVWHNPLNSAPSLVAARAAALALGLQLHLVEVRRPSELPSALSAAASAKADAILALSDPVIGNALTPLAQMALTQRMPAIYSRSEFAERGGLLAYGPDFAVNYRRAAAYVDKILKGAKPGELPVEQPTRFELVVNLKTAKALGLQIPSQLLQRADRFIE
ncbi:MAG: ABC transporter substrate-binding protein [Casimicrobiaceae bacterium]